MKPAHSIFRQRLFASLSVALFLTGIYHSFHFPYITLFGLQEVGMSPMALGAFLSVSTIGGIVAGTIVGRISDRARSRKRVLMGVIVSGMAGYSVYAFSRDYVLLLVAALFLVSFSWSTFPQLFAFAGEIDAEGREESRAMATSILRAIFAVGWVVGPVIGAFLLEEAGFTALYLSIVLIFGAIFAIVWLFVNDRRPDAAGGEKAAGKAGMISRNLLINAAGFCAIFLASSLNGYAFPLFVTDTLGAQEKHVGYLLGLAAAFEIPLMIFGGYLVRRIGTLNLIKVGFAGYLAYYTAILLTKDLVFLYPVQIISALAISQIMGTGISYFQEMASDQPGTTITLFNNTQAVSGILAGILFGSLVSRFDYRTVYLFSAAFAAIALLTLHLANTRRMAPNRSTAADQDRTVIE